MATEEEEKRWGARLKERGFVIRRINLQNDRMMEAIYTLLGVTEDFAKQTQVDEFIEKQKDANGGREDYKELLDDYNVHNLKNGSGQIIRYDSLEEGKTYRLGDSVEQQQKKMKFEMVTPTFICFKELGPGKEWKAIQRGYDFFEEAKVFIASAWGLDTDPSEIHLACYVQGVEHRVQFDDSIGYWNLKPSTNSIYFWVGAKTDSPVRQQELMSEKIDALTIEVQRLRAVSGTAADQVHLWSERTEFDIESVESKFSVNTIDAQSAAKAKKELDRGPTEPKEAGVQSMWNRVLRSLPREVIWHDCTSPNGIEYDGRRHDIDLVLLTRDILSILYLDSPIELKDSISTDAKRREVVLQLLDRFATMFDGQPDRRECWGLGMDSKHVLFVKCQRDPFLAYSVTPNCGFTGCGWNLLLKFLSATADVRGYVPISLPVLWRRTPQSRLGRNVYLLDESVACKVGNEEQMRREYELLFELKSKVPIPIPVSETRDIRTGNATHPGGFLMPRYHVTRVVSEVEVVKLASHIFWDLAVLHTKGIVHRDVKPSNFLCCGDDSNRRYLLSDYGAAESWTPTTGRMSASATELYASIPGTFEGTLESMYQRDHESLYWSVFALWLQVVKQREAPGKFRVDRLTDIAVLRDTGGSYLGDSPPVLKHPSDPTLTDFLVVQARNRRLHCPFTVFQKIYTVGMSVDQFNEKAREQRMLPCQPEVFEVLCSKHNNKS